MDNEKVKELAVLQEARFKNAISCLAEMIDRPHESRSILRFYISEGLVSRDDPWVDAAMSCVNLEDVQSVALWFFMTDVKEGLYDTVAPQAEVPA